MSTLKLVSDIEIGAGDFLMLSLCFHNLERRIKGNHDYEGYRVTAVGRKYYHLQYFYKHRDFEKLFFNAVSEKEYKEIVHLALEKGFLVKATEVEKQKLHIVDYSEEANHFIF